MYAVIKTGGRQYKVEPGQMVRVNKLAGQVGESVTLPEVLLVKEGDSLKAGSPLLEGASVSATIVEQDRGKKIIVFKKKRRQGYQKTQGHRQDYTTVKINSVNI